MKEILLGQYHPGDKILIKNRGEKIVVVTHGGVIKVWLTSWLEMPLASVHKISIDSGKLVKVFYYKDFPVLKSLNKSKNLKYYY